MKQVTFKGEGCSPRSLAADSDSSEQENIPEMHLNDSLSAFASTLPAGVQAANQQASIGGSDLQPTLSSTLLAPLPGTILLFLELLLN